MEVADRVEKPVVVMALLDKSSVFKVLKLPEANRVGGREVKELSDTCSSLRLVRDDIEGGKATMELVERLRDVRLGSGRHWGGMDGRELEERLSVFRDRGRGGTDMSGFGGEDENFCAKRGAKLN